MFIMNIDARIRQFREKLGLTQKDLANRSGLSQQAISRFESGKHTPRSDSLKRIAEALETTVAELYGDPEVPIFDPEMLEIAGRLLEADRKEPGTIERLMQLIHRGFLDTPEDMEDLLTVARMLQSRSEK